MRFERIGRRSLLPPSFVVCRNAEGTRQEEDIKLIRDSDTSLHNDERDPKRTLVKNTSMKYSLRLTCIQIGSRWYAISLAVVATRCPHYIGSVAAGLETAYHLQP